MSDLNSLSGTAGMTRSQSHTAVCFISRSRDYASTKHAVSAITNHSERYKGRFGF
jgi:hypothetical protein